MAPHAIISYDDTVSDYDALALGQVLAAAGSRLTLAYVRHAIQIEPTAERLEEDEARSLLDRGASRLGSVEIELRVVVSASTSEGLKWLAREADLIVFGSDYRTAPGHLDPQHTAQSLLDGGTTAVALAPAGYSRGRPGIATIGILDDPGDDAALQTAWRLTESLGAAIVSYERHPDLLVIASRPEAAPGQVMLSARAQKGIEDASCPVIVIARGVPIEFAAPVLASS